MRQKRGHAIAESIANTIVGFAVSNVAWPWISIYLLHKPYRAAEGLSVITAFTLLSIARNYAVRRLFDHHHHARGPDNEPKEKTERPDPRIETVAEYRRRIGEQIRRASEADIHDSDR